MHHFNTIPKDIWWIILLSKLLNVIFVCSATYRTLFHCWYSTVSRCPHSRPSTTICFLGERCWVRMSVQRSTILTWIFIVFSYSLEARSEITLSDRPQPLPSDVKCKALYLSSRNTLLLYSFVNQKRLKTLWQMSTALCASFLIILEVFILQNARVSVVWANTSPADMAA
jgi:hypothetical protein